MSMIDRIFGSGDEEDDKRTEVGKNIEKIKEIVNKGNRSNKAEESSEADLDIKKDIEKPSNPPGLEEIGSKESEESEKSEVPESPEERSERRYEKEEGEKRYEKEPVRGGVERETERYEKEDRYEKKEGGKDIDRPRPVEPIEEEERESDREEIDVEVPEAPETREVETPDIQAGPLFIRVEKFRKANRIIKDMKDTIRDLESGVGGLRNGLEEDKEIREELDGVLHRLETSLSSVKNIVSP
ncbi:MAG: hypothetical protein SVV03_03810 [Candidatus Nanohaloarchaea archaeon]|nr:hypothetical protein [Candidatus Nanohaloarchaea archaeon]